MTARCRLRCYPVAEPVAGEKSAQVPCVWGVVNLSWKDMETTIQKQSQATNSSWLIKGEQKEREMQQSRRYQRQATRINCDFTRLVL